MTILYTSFNVNHHQVPFVQALMKLVGVENVKYAAIHTFEQSRVQMGMNVYKGDWIIDISSEWSKFEHYWMSADVVLCNVRDFYELFEKRLKTGKLTFYYSERWFKEPYGLWRLLHPHILFLINKYYHLSKYNNFYYLPQGLYAYGDLAKFNIFKGKSFSFGYLTPINFPAYSSSKQLYPGKSINILWAGKIHHVKRVDILAQAFVSLFQKVGGVHLTVIGEGPEKKKVEKILSTLPNSCYTLLPYVKNEELHEYMRQADIYVFPSNGAEGWGAVVNEAMSEECAVVVSNKVGAISMIEDGVNGLIFENENVNSLTHNLIRLVSDGLLIRKLKKAGRRTVQEEWNADNAAKKFIELCDYINNGKKVEIDSGIFKKL